MTLRKTGAAATQRDAATVRVNAQLVKLEEHTRRSWSADAERLAAVDAAILHAWSQREASAHVAEIAEGSVAGLEQLVRQASHEAFALVDRIESLNDTTRH